MVACSPCSPNYYTITITIMFQCYCLVIASTELCELVNIAQIMLFRWGLMTITTVGYDLSPKTFLGGHFDILVFYMYWRDQSYIGIQQKIFNSSRKDYRRLLRPLWSLYPHPSHSYCGKVFHISKIKDAKIKGVFYWI